MSVSESRSEFDTRITALLTSPADQALEYHALTFDIEAGDRWVLGTLSTRWVDWADDKKRTELRVSAPVSAQYASGLAQIGIDCLFITDEVDMLMFMRGKQPALIERMIAERFFPSLLHPFVALHHGRSGFVDEGRLSRGTRGRRPGTKQRAAILLRDGQICQLCRRDPKHFDDMELEVHHIRPWKNGGTSDATNLITLCRRCHKSLKPHFNRSLFELVEQNDGMTELKRFAASSAARQAAQGR